MSILIEREDGMTFTLPPAFALDEGSLSLEIPGAEIPERHGAWPFDSLRRAEPRQLRASATIKGISRDDADRLAEDLYAKLLGGGVLRLRRSASSWLWIACEVAEVHHRYHRGIFGGSVFTAEVTFEALDPWWYAAQATGVLHETARSGEEWLVTHMGTDGNQPTVVRIYPAEGTLVNPVLTSVAKGDVAKFTGQIGADQVLVLNSFARKAWLEDWSGAYLDPTGGPAVTNVTAAMGVEFQARGLRLLPGEHTLRYEDDPASSHKARVLVEFRPRSW